MSPQETSQVRPVPGRLNVAATWRTDVATARGDLEASAAEAFVLAAHAFAWRVAALTLPVAVVVAGWFVARGDATPSVLPLAAGLGVLGPQLLAFLLTLPADLLATFRTWHRGSRTQFIRFGLTSAAYPYYGWRYAYRGRRRPWGALTHEERMRSNPERAGAAASVESGARARSR